MPEIELKKIQPNRFNPRTEFSKIGLDQLVDSIRQFGVLEPVVLRPIKEGRYEIVVGERRYRAAQQVGIDKIPATVHDYSDDEVLELNLVENIQREDLSAIEKGKVCKELLEKFPEKYPSEGAVAKRIGIGQSSVSEWIEAMGMPIGIQRLVAPQTERKAVPKGKIDYDTAVRIARKVKDPDRAVEIAKTIATRRVPRRVALDIAKKAVLEPRKSVATIFKETVDDVLAVLPFSAKHASDILEGTKVQTSRKSIDPKIRPGAIVRGQITHFADLKIVDVQRKKLGEFNDEDAKKEGGYTLKEFKEVWKKLHGEWNPDGAVYTIIFKVEKAMHD
jgi:ParB/RepB/Spo0J family partition protein